MSKITFIAVEKIGKTLKNIQIILLVDFTELTAGGRIDTEIATPTNDPMFSPKMAIATAAPDGNAVNAPISNE